MQDRRKTRNYFPEPHFQFRFLRFLMIGSILQICATCAILYYFLRENYVVLVQYGGLEQDIQDILYRELRVLISLVSGTFIFYLAAVLILGIFFSHRIAGAIYATKRTIKAISEGKDEKLRFRNGDEFQDLVEGFNRMVSQLRASTENPPSVTSKN